MTGISRQNQGSVKLNLAVDENTKNPFHEKHRKKVTFEVREAEFSIKAGLSI